MVSNFSYSWSLSGNSPALEGTRGNDRSSTTALGIYSPVSARMASYNNK